jgi:hypothetical protein
LKKEWKMKSVRFLVVLSALVLLLTGCFFTKAVTVPLRLGGAVISVVPVAGGTVHSGIDKVADTVDDIPF